MQWLAIWSMLDWAWMFVSLLERQKAILVSSHSCLAKVYCRKLTFGLVSSACFYASRNVYNLERQHSQIAVDGVFWPVPGQIHTLIFTCFVCVWMMWSDWGWSLGEGANFISANWLKNSVSWHYQAQKAVWCKLFVNLVCTLWLYPFIHRHDLEAYDSRLS